jgi:hypothetical protein
MQNRHNVTVVRKVLVWVGCVTTLISAVPNVANATSATRGAGSACTRWLTVVTTSGKTLRCVVSPNVAKASQLQRRAKVLPRRDTKPTSVAPFLAAGVSSVASEQAAPTEIVRQLDTIEAVTPVETAVKPAVPELTTAPEANTVPNSTSNEPSYPIVPDPENGGSPDVVIGNPESSERPNPSLASRVEGFVLQSVAETSASFTLTPTSGIASYQVYVRYDDSYTLKGIDANNPVVTFSDLTPDWAYTACAYYFVNSAESEKSCLSFRTTGSRPAAVVPPAGPASVSATATEDSITVSWSAVTGAERYSLCHVRDDSMQCGGYTMQSDTSAIFHDGSVYPGWTYTVKVQAVFPDGTRSRESLTSVRSAGSRPVPPARLVGAKNFRVTAVTPTTATVAWDYEGAASLTSWTVTSRHLTSYSAIGADPSAREFTITDLSPGLGYEFTIMGRTADNETETASTNALMPSN